MTHKKILEMIENVDPSDTDTLDEIDILVFRFARVDGCYPAVPINVEKSWPKYTRSRDAIKSIRPDGWWIWLEPEQSEKTGKIYTEMIGYCISKVDFKHRIPSGYRVFKTEELAELHAVIQAIAHERGEG